MIAVFALPLTGSEPCQQVDPELFFSECSAESARLAPQLKQLCSSCPILSECAEHALHHEEFGFWGGMSARERSIVRKRRGIKLDSVAVVNGRILRDRIQSQKEWDRYVMSLLPSRSDAQWKVAGSGEERSGAA